MSVQYCSINNTWAASTPISMFFFNFFKPLLLIIFFPSHFLISRVIFFETVTGREKGFYTVSMTIINPRKKNANTLKNKLFRMIVTFKISHIKVRYSGYLFFSVTDRNLFHRVDTIGNIFTSGTATRKNITDGVHSMK